MALSFTDVNPDPVMSQIATEFGKGGQFAYLQVAPHATVPTKYFRHGEWDFADGVSYHNDTKMPDNGPANIAKTPGFDWTTSICKAFGLKDRFGDTERAESMNAQNWENNIIGNLVHQQQMEIEIDLKTKLDAAANATTLTGTSQWNNAAPIIETTIKNAIIAFRHLCGFNPTHMVIPEDCWSVLTQDSTIRDAIRYTHANILEGDDGGLKAPLFGLIPVVPTALQNSANPGATASVAEIWSSDKVYFLHVNPGFASNQALMTSVYMAMSATLPDMTWAARSWRPANLDELWTWYAVTQNHVLNAQAKAIYRMDDVLA